MAQKGSNSESKVLRERINNWKWIKRNLSMNLSSAHIHGIISFPLPIKKGVRVRVTIVKQASIMEKFTFF